MQVQNRYPFSIICVSNNDKQLQAFVQKVYLFIGFGCTLGMLNFLYVQYISLGDIAPMRFGPNVYIICIVCTTHCAREIFAIMNRAVYIQTFSSLTSVATYRVQRDFGKAYTRYMGLSSKQVRC